MRIFVDADACPVPIKEVIAAEAHKNGLQAIFVCSTAHYSPQQAQVEWLLVDSHAQAVDILIGNQVAPGDVVVTQDYGLAALAIGKGSYALSPRGHIFNQENIDNLLAQRHIFLKLRSSGGRPKGPAKLTSADVARFKHNLAGLLQSK